MRCAACQHEQLLHAMRLSPKMAPQPAVSRRVSGASLNGMPLLSARRYSTPRGSPTTRAALELIALTFVRTTELIEAT